MSMIIWITGWVFWSCVCVFFGAWIHEHEDEDFQQVFVPMLWITTIVSLTAWIVLKMVQWGIIS